MTDLVPNASVPDWVKASQQSGRLLTGSTVPHSRPSSGRFLWRLSRHSMLAASPRRFVVSCLGSVLDAHPDPMAKYMGQRLIEVVAE
jgi:hypothetical protein